jgi:cytochrome c oxidase subunit III
MVVNTLTDIDAKQKERELNSLFQLGILLTLVVVTITFGSLVFAFVYRSEVPRNWTHIELPPTLWLSTALLLSSSALLESGRRRLKQGDQRAFYRVACWATGLGVLFLAAQSIAWFQILRSGVLLESNPHSSFIFIFSGIHGVHILVGLAGLFYLLRRTREHATGPKYQMTTRVWANAVSTFWHYLDFVWVVLFALLLTWKR